MAAVFVALLHVLIGLIAAIALAVATFCGVYLALFVWGTRTRPRLAIELRAADLSPPPLPAPPPPPALPPLPPPRPPDQYNELGESDILLGRHAPPLILRSFRARCPCGWESQAWNGGAGAGMAQLDYVRHKARFETLGEEGA